MLTRTLMKIGAAAAALFALAGCERTTAVAGGGTITALLTDGPSENIQTATVWISKVYLIAGSDTTGTRFTIDSTPAQFDLLSLQGGVTAELGTKTIPVGAYSQLRLVVDSAQVTLKPPLTFSDGSSTKLLKVPSGMQTGIKVNFDAPVNVVPGQTILVVDFDASRNFVFTGPSSSPNGVLFKPVLHATVQNVAASIAGTVATVAARAKLYAIMTSDNDTVTTALADTTTGAYKLWFLPPGAYTVTAVGTASGSTYNQSLSVTVRAGQDTTGVNFP